MTVVKLYSGSNGINGKDAVGADNSIPDIMNSTELRSRTYNTGIFASDSFEVTDKQ